MRSSRIGRWLLNATRVLALGLVLVVAAYCNGVWPHSVVCEVSGPDGARLVAVAGRSCDESLPHEIHRWSSGLQVSGDRLACPVEVLVGKVRARGRLLAQPIACLTTGYMDLVSAVESMDGSAWMRTDVNRVEMRPARPDGVWFACSLWGRQHLTLRGVEGPFSDHGILELAASEEQTILATSWSIRIAADGGTSVSLREWASDQPMVSLACDDSGFTSGAVTVGDEAPVPVDLAVPKAFHTGSLHVDLQSKDGRTARVHVTFRQPSHLTVRVSR